MLLLDLAEGDEVILAVVYLVSYGQCYRACWWETGNICGCRFSDLEPRSYSGSTGNHGTNQSDYASALCRSRMRDGHSYGVMDAHQLILVEDAAQALNARNNQAVDNRNLGAFSFHQTKNYSCGEGGAALY